MQLQQMFTSDIHLLEKRFREVFMKGGSFQHLETETVAN